MKKFVALLAEENQISDENDDFGILQTLYSAYKKLGQFFFHNYLLTCLNKDTSVLLKVINT